MKNAFERLTDYRLKLLDRAEREVTTGAYAGDLNHMTQALFYENQRQPQAPPIVINPEATVIKSPVDLYTLQNVLSWAQANSASGDVAALDELLDRVSVALQQLSSPTP